MRLNKPWIWKHLLLLDIIWETLCKRMLRFYFPLYSVRWNLTCLGPHVCAHVRACALFICSDAFLTRSELGSNRLLLCLSVCASPIKQVAAASASSPPLFPNFFFFLCFRRAQERKSFFHSHMLTSSKVQTLKYLYRCSVVEFLQHQQGYNINCLG